MGNTNEHISTNIHPLKYINGSMGKWYPNTTEWEKILWQFFIFMELEPFFLLFYDDQDTENE